MIILNQNKHIMVNTDKITTIERNGHKINCYFNDSPCPQPLGDYPTDKRAQEVLMELFRCFDYTAAAEVRGDGYTNASINFDFPHQTYEMPEV